MERRDSDAPIGAILTAIGGAILAVGSVLTWAKVSVDLGALANALGVDPALLSGAGDQTSKTFAGTSVNEGKIVLACGIVALLVALAAYMRHELWKVLGIVAIVAGLVGAAFALYDISTKENVASDANDALAPSLAAVGVDPSVLGDVIKVDLGIGIWASVAGGIVAGIGGLLLVTKKPDAQPSLAMGEGPAPYIPPDSGFTPPSASPAAPVSPAADAPPPPPPAPAPVPVPPEVDTGTGAPDGGGNAPPPD